MTFVIRLTVAEDGRLTGVVTRVTTGEKARFEGVEAIGPLIARMTSTDEDGRGGPR
jgi:hypothetical protein